MVSEQVKKLYEKFKREAEVSGYLLNPDMDFVLDLMEGLLTNQKRYGYWACPCRLADGERNQDLDIICPCDYRDPDLEEYGACYCALYVSEQIANGTRKLEPVPERRVIGVDEKRTEQENKSIGSARNEFPVWRCKVCGYLCARTAPPLRCPICKAEKDRFEHFS